MKDYSKSLQSVYLCCFSFYLQPKSLGHTLFIEVCKKLHLLECDYFDLEFIDHCGVAVSIPYPVIPYPVIPYHLV